MQLYTTLIAGATAVVRRKFRASRCIHDLVEYGATATNSLGVVIVFVLQQEPSELDNKHRLRALGVAPNPVELDPQLRRRFGFKDVIGMYGMTQYMQIPDKTVEACRNFCFHPGDGSTTDEDGFAYFIDRIKDCVRRRGEDISSFQVEQVIAEHPAVAEVAAISKEQKNPLRQLKITARTWGRQARRQG